MSFSFELILGFKRPLDKKFSIKELPFSFKYLFIEFMILFINLILFPIRNLFDK